MKILIVEDEPLYVGTLCILIDQLGHQLAGVADESDKAIELFFEQQPDLMLVDINLKGDSDGIDFALQVNNYQKTPTIFITSLRDDKTFARAQAIHPFAFILKPFDKLLLQRTIELVNGQFQRNQKNNSSPSDKKINSSFFVSVGRKLERINTEDVLFLSADGRYTNIHTLSARKLVVRQTLGELGGRLPNGEFYRTHRSYVINVKYLQSLDFSDMVVWVNGKPIPLSKRNKSGLSEYFNRL